MLKITNQNIQPDKEREFQGIEKFGLQLSPNDKPLQIYDAFSIGGNIIFFYAYQLTFEKKIVKTFELSLDTLIYQDGQYLIDASKYFDNVSNSVLPDGFYCLSFGNGTEIFESERFRVFNFQFTGGTYTAPEIKHMENDPIFIFND
jgi:hypothetical protein